MRYFSRCLSIAICLSLNSFLLPTSASADTKSAFDSNLAPIQQVPIPVPETVSPGICFDSIAPTIDNITQRPGLNQGKWAVLVQSLGGTNIYSQNPDSYMVPASNMKLLVTAAALQKLNPNGQIRSTSIGNWIKVTNLRSNNAYANVLLSYLGGSQSVEQALTTLGIDAKGYRLSDGSGLSRHNLATPRTLVSTLRAMYHARGNEVFLASLPVAGISGTLKNRLRQTSAQGLVKAKTGSLRGVRALSGYVEHPEYGTLVFSIITNQSINQSSTPVVQAIDDIVVSLSKFTNCR